MNYDIHMTRRYYTSGVAHQSLNAGQKNLMLHVTRDIYSRLNSSSTPICLPMIRRITVDVTGHPPSFDE